MPFEEVYVQKSKLSLTRQWQTHPKSNLLDFTTLIMHPASELAEPHACGAVRVWLGARARADEMLEQHGHGHGRGRGQQAAAPTLPFSLTSLLLNSCCAAPDPLAKIMISAEN